MFKLRNFIKTILVLNLSFLLLITEGTAGRSLPSFFNLAIPQPENLTTDSFKTLDDEELDSLIERLSSPRWRVRRQAIDLITEGFHPKKLEILRSKINLAKRDSLFHGIVIILGLSGESSVLDFILQRLEDRAFREEIPYLLKALGGIKTRKAIRRLINFLTVDRGRYSKTIISVLQEITEEPTDYSFVARELNQIHLYNKSFWKVYYTGVALVAITKNKSEEEISLILESLVQAIEERITAFERQGGRSAQENRKFLPILTFLAISDLETFEDKYEAYIKYAPAEDHYHARDFLAIRRDAGRVFQMVDSWFDEDYQELLDLSMEIFLKNEYPENQLLAALDLIDRFDFTITYYIGSGDQERALEIYKKRDIFVEKLVRFLVVDDLDIQDIIRDYLISRREKNPKDILRGFLRALKDQTEPDAIWQLLDEIERVLGSKIQENLLAWLRLSPEIMIQVEEIANSELSTIYSTKRGHHFILHGLIVPIRESSVVRTAILAGKPEGQFKWPTLLKSA